MKTAASTVIALVLALAGAGMIWKLHAVPALLGIGLVMVAVGLCGAVAAVAGVAPGVILAGAGSVAVALGLLWILGRTGG